jgi:hypothetical protein
MAYDDAQETKAKPGSDEAIHEEALCEFKLCQDAEMENRKLAADDLRFARLGEQWPDAVKSKREQDKRPCMTFNKMPTFIRSVVNDGRQNKPAIKVHPADDDADPETAEVINGLIRNIENSSDSEVAYDTGLDFAASCGIGYWRVGMEYSHDDTFDMDLEIQRVANPFSVYGDYESTAADSSDWNRAFVVDMVPKDVFQKKYKGKDKIDWDSDQYRGMAEEWREGTNVMVAEYWCRKEIIRTISLLSNGMVVDDEWLNEQVDTEGMPDGLPIASMTNAELMEQAGVTVENSRDTRSWKVTQYIMSGVEILEKNDWPGRYIPIVPVYGEELNIEGKRHFRSLIRDAKDAQRNFNYWRTTSTENLGLTTKAPWIGPVGAFDTDRDKWENANTENYPFIEYDGEQGPTRQGFSGPDVGALQEAMNASDDMKSIIGIFDPSLGAKSNETSGVAINARKQQSSISTFHFVDNQARAIRHTGRLLIDLIPHCYNKARVVRIMGADKKPQNVPVNQEIPGGAGQGEDGAARIYDLTLGKYDLTVDTGPGFQTKREEAAYGMTELMRAFPPSAAVIGPHLAKAQDWPGADEIGDELAALAPGGAQNNPLQQQVQQMGQQLQESQQKIQTMEQDRSIESAKLQIEQFNAETNRMKAMKELEPAAPDAPDTTLPEAVKLDIQHQHKLEEKALDIEGQKQLEILKQQGVPPTPEAMEEQAMSQQVMTQLLAEVGGLKQMIAAPRKRTLVRDPVSGRAIEALDEIMMPEAPADQQQEQI